MDANSRTDAFLRSKDNVWGFDSDWQTPARTEEHAFRRCWDSLPETPWATYVGFPWATLIDHLQTKSDKSGALEDALRRFASAFHSARRQRPGRVVTVCQHVMARDFSAIFKKLGVTDIFWSHAEHSTREIDGISVHPFPLYPALTGGILQQDAGAPLRERKYLYSFTGAYEPRYYRTESRVWLAAMPQQVGERAALVQLRREWHFQNTVYDSQVRGVAPSSAELLAMRQRERDYLELMRQTVFSLCPSGSGPNSIRLWESMALGSVPVILADGLQLPGDPMLWQEAAVFVRETPKAVTALPHMLAELIRNADVVEAKRRACCKLYDRFGPGDFIYDIRELMRNAPEVVLPRADSPHVWVLDPGLKDTRSHHHVVNSHLQRRAQSEKRLIRVHGHSKAKPQDFPYIVVPQFRFSVYDDSASLDAAAWQAQVLAHFQDLQPLLARADGVALVVHTTTAAFLQGLALALLHNCVRVASLVVELMFHPLSFIKGGQSVQQPNARYMTALRLLKRYQREAGVLVHISTSCHEFAVYFGGLLREPVPCHPYALLASDDPPAEAPLPPAAGAPLQVLLFAGDLKLDKGVGWITAALPTVLTTFPSVDFFVHFGENRFGVAHLSEIQETAISLVPRHKNFKLLQGYLPESVWDVMLRSLDVCVIPYDPSSYAHKTSGVFWDCMRKLRPTARMLVTRGTWLEREAAASGLDVASCCFGDTQSLLAVLDEMIRDSRSAARTTNPAYRAAFNRYFDQGNDEFIFSLL